MFQGTRILTYKAPWESNVKFLFREQIGNKVYNAAPLLMKDVTNEMEINPLPTFELRPEAIQDLFNELWILGFRPQDGTGNVGHLKAVENHLADLQKIVFKGK